MILREKGSLYGLFVLPAYEGRGIGRRLTKIAEQELFKHHEVAWLETDKNSRAAKFYMQLGWGNKTTLDGAFIRLEKQRGSRPSTALIELSFWQAAASQWTGMYVKSEQRT